MSAVIAPDMPDIDVKLWQYCHPFWHGAMQQISHNDPEALYIPHSVEVLQAIVRGAHRDRKTLIPCGNGTKLTWGGLTPGVDWLVSTQRLQAIADHAVNDLTITVQAGMTLAALQAYLKPHHQFLPIDAAFPEQATLGGIVATANAGSWRHRYGGVRDLLLGISLVRADGEAVKAGGKVVKNVAGYDLMKLLTGSYGSLAIITELTFRLYPLQEQNSTVLLAGSQTQIAAARHRLSQSVLTPLAADLLSPHLMRMLNLGADFGLVVQFQAIQESITAQVDELQAIATDLALETNFFSQADADLPWTKMREYLYEAPVICKVGILPSHATELLSHLESLSQGQASGRIHIKSGLGTLVFPHAKFLRQFRQLREFCEAHQGFLTVLKAPYRLKKQFEPWGYHQNALPLMQKIKQQFDPINIFSPGRFVGGI